MWVAGELGSLEGEDVSQSNETTHEFVCIRFYPFRSSLFLPLALSLLRTQVIRDCERSTSDARSFARHTISGVDMNADAAAGAAALTITPFREKWL